MTQAALEPTASSPDEEHANRLYGPGLFKVTWL